MEQQLHPAYKQKNETKSRHIQIDHALYYSI